MSRKIDYLSEDAPINGQAVALISIIGPHMRQKCDVWGIKIKGTASSEEEADKMGKRLQALDPDIDIFRVPVGKFFPLAIDPASADNTIYQDEQLNELIKQNKLNRMQAKDHFEQRKQKMMEDAIREGKGGSNSVEHPVALLDRVNTTERRIKELTQELESLQKTRDLTQLKFNELSVDEKVKATDEFNKINGTTVNEIESKNLIEETNNTKEILESIKTIEEKLEKGKVSESEAIELNTQLNILKGQLTTKGTNEFINDSFKDSQYNGMF
jgi:hypothetical protein